MNMPSHVRSIAVAALVAAGTAAAAAETAADKVTIREFLAKKVDVFDARRVRIRTMPAPRVPVEAWKEKDGYVRLQDGERDVWVSSFDVVTGASVCAADANHGGKRPRVAGAHGIGDC